MKAKRDRGMRKDRLGFYAIALSSLFLGYIVFPAHVALGGDLPAGPAVQAGDPTITSDGQHMTVDAGSHDKTWIDWQGGFNIGANNSVNNIGPDASAVILHHDISGSVSNIQGALSGNCNVFLLNASGVLFAPGSQVNVGGLVVSTMHMSVDDFKAGRYVLNSDGIDKPGLIVNAGTITAQNPTGVTLAGGAVRNEGVINADLGTVNMVSGSEVTLKVNGDGSIQAVVNKAVLKNVYDKDNNRVTVGVDNVGDINAKGGQVFMEAEAVKDVFDTLINQQGVVKAGSMVNRNGKITLTSDSDGIVQNTGTLDTSAVEAGAKGGTIEMRGHKVGQFSMARADGANGGGEVTLRGRSVVTLGSGSVTTANAGASGTGGKVTVYSPEAALFKEGARIEAKGGTLSGDGGFVEVSGKTYLLFKGKVDASAPAGNAGTLLIDPGSLEIVTAGAGAPVWADHSDTFYYDSADSTKLSPTDIITELGSQNVLLLADNSITVTDIVSYNSANSLKLQTTSGGTVAVNAAITNAGTGDLILNAGSSNIVISANISTGGNIDIDTTSTFAVTAGSRVIGGGDGTTITVNARGITLGAGGNGTETLTNSGTGTISITSAGANDVTLNDYAIGNGTGLVSISSARDINGNGNATPDIQSSGSVTLTASGIGNTSTLAIGGTSSDDTLTVTNGAHNVSIIETANRFSTVSVFQCTTICSIDIDLYGADYIDIDPNAGAVELAQIITSAYNRNFIYNGSEAGAAVGVGALGPVNTGSGSLTITARGITGHAAMTVGGTLTMNTGSYAIDLSGYDNNIATLGAVTAGGGFNLNNGDNSVTLTGTINTSGSGSVTIDAGTGAIDTNDQIITAGSGAITLISDSIDLGTTANTIRTTGAVILETTTTDRTIGIAGGAGDYNLTAAEIAAIQNGASSITIGRTDSDADITIGAITFYDPVTIRAPNGGKVYVNGLITGLDNASISITGLGATTVLNANIVTAGNAITIDDSVRVGAAGGVTLDTTGSGVTAGNNITITGAVDSTLGHVYSLTLNGGTNGAVSIVGDTGTSDAIATFTVTSAAQVDLAKVRANTISVTGSSIDLNGTAYTALTDDVLFTGAVNLNSGGPITVTSGLGAGDDITFSSTINGVQSLDLIAGLGSVTVSSAVGGTTALNQFKITSAAQVDVGSITANTIDITGSDIDLNGTTYTALGSSITFNGPIAVIGAGTTTIMANGDIHLNGSLNGTVAGASSLTLDATNGTVYAEGLGATTALNVLNISGVAAQLNGNITVTSINTLEVGLTTLTNNITITASGGGGDVILLGNLAGASGLTLNANGVAHTGDIVLFDADINYLIISDARDVTFSGDFVTASDVTVANRRYITVSAGNSIQAGGAVSLIGDTVIDNGLIAGDSITISGATSIQLNGNVNGGNGLVHFVNPVRLTGDSVVSSANGNITFEGQLYGAYDIAINAPVGTVTLPMVGSDGRLTGLTVNANNLTLNSSVYVNGNIDVNVNSVTLGAGEIVITTTGSNGYIDFGTALIDAASGATVDLGITANGSGNVVLGTIGSLLPLHTISVATTSGITTLNGNITASGTGSNVIKLSGVPVIHLADNVTLRTTAAGDIVLTGGAIDGAYTLTVISGRDITTGAIGQNIKLESLSMTAARELTINGAISTLEDLRLIATTDDVNVGGALIGHDVYINAVAGSIIVSVAQNNTVGSITFNAGTLIDINATIQVLNNLTLESVSNVGGDLIAGDNIIINNEMTISGGARIFTVTYGNIDINANIMGGVNLTLSAVNGTIYVTTIGGTTPVAALVLISQYAQLGGNIYATSINTTSVGLTTLIANVTITTTGSGNVINLWDIDGAKNLTLIATNALGNIIVNNGNIAVLTITDGNGLTVNGNFIASGLVSVTGLTGTIAVGSGGSLQAGGGLTLTTSGGIVNNGLISGLSVTLTGATGIDLNGYIVVDYGVLELVSPVVLTGDTVISIANGTVIFDGDVSGPYVLTVNALNGHVTFLSTIGGGVDPLGLIIHADYLDLYGTVTVNGNIYVNANHIVLYTGAGIITTTGSNGYIDFDHALIDAATGAAIDLVITANGSGNVFLGTIGSLDPIRSLRVITGTGTTTLYGNIIADGIGANIINLSATSTIILGNDITVQTINAGDIVLTGGAIDGAHVLTVLSGRDIFVDGIGHTIPLTAVYMLAGRELTVNDYIYVVESLRLIATLDDINIGGNLIGHDVFVNAVAGSIIVSVAQNNTLGSITLTAGTLIDINVTIQELNNIIIESIVYVGGDLTAGDNIIINGVVHLTDGARIFTATHGFIDINANIMGAQNLTLSAINGTIYCSTIGDTTPVLALVLISQYAELYGNITVTSIDTTGVGLTTLTGDVIITASGSGNAIYLGPLAGTHGLTLVATNGAGNIIIGDGNIALFTITDGNNVTFNGQLVTSCGISVTGIDGDILVPTGESIVTGGSLVLTTPGRIINNGLISGGLVSLTGLTAIELNGTIIGGDGLIRFYSPVILTGNTIIGSANNSVQFDGDVSGPYVLTVNAVNGSVTFLSTIGGGVDPLGLIIHTDYLHLYGTVTVNGNIYVNANYIVFHPGSGIITTTGSNGYINLDHAFIDAATGAVINLVITANGSGNVFLGTIGSLDPIRSLQVITGTGSTTLYGNITADGIGTNIINLSTTSTIILGNDITIYTINAGDIVLTGGAIDHAYVLTVISGHDIFVGPIGQVIPLTAIYMIANNELTISGNIYVTESLRLIATIDDINIGGNLTGHDVFVTATAGSIIVSVARTTPWARSP